MIEAALGHAAPVRVILGSAHRARTIRDPWSANERREMIRACFPEDASRLLFASVEDRLYNDQQWLADVQAAVDIVVKDNVSAMQNTGVTLVGHAKGDSSLYLKLFPQWALHEVALVEGLSAIDIRDLYFGTEEDEGRGKQLRALLPAPVHAYLRVFRSGTKYPDLKREWQFIHDFRKQFQGLQYPPTFVTCDAMVVQSGHLLLVQRGAEPGKGLWALPGGFVDITERIETAMLRELHEEARIKCPEPVVRGGIRASHVFDHPERSLRGRTITHAYLIVLAPHGPGLYSITAGSDAGNAGWFPISTVLAMGESMFDDHLDIIHYFLGHI